MSRKAAIVIGLGFGDEGKGLATDYLCCQTPDSLVIRFNGGQQAGHTVVTSSGHRHVFSSFGSGTLRGAPTYWSRFCTISPGALLNEYQSLISQGVQPHLLLDSVCPVTTHYDVLYNRLLEKARGNSRHGSCGMGFGATIERHQLSPVKLFAQDLAFPEIVQFRLKSIRTYYQQKLTSEGNTEFAQLNHDAEDRRFLHYVERIAALRQQSVIRLVNEADVFASNQSWQNYIFEGAQGVLLDMDFGFYPHVTRSHTTARNALELIRDNLKDSLDSVEVYYITRAYQTRHGEGPMTHEDSTLQLVNNTEETNQYNEHQGRLRISPLDIDLLQYALQCDAHFSHGLPKHLLVTCLDQLADQQIPVFQQNTHHIITPNALPHLLNYPFTSHQFSYSHCAEYLCS